MDGRKAEVFFEGVEITVAVQERMLIQQAAGGGDAVNGFADGQALPAQGLGTEL